MAGTIQQAFEAVGVEAPSDLLQRTLPAGSDPPASLPADAGLGADEIQPGIAVLKLDPLLLLRDKRVQCTQDAPGTRIGPFVCVEVSPDSSQTTWASLTSNQRLERLVIEESWRLGGNYKWRRGQLLLTDAATLWRGPRDAFATASWRDGINTSVERPRLTPEGIVAIRQRIADSPGAEAVHERAMSSRSPAPQ
jgi:hypothetical protein